MKFKNIRIKNFRNFKDVSIDLDNKNIFFGLNDIGKTNFLYAIRYVLDKNIRKNNLIDSDFHKKNINEPIEILISIDLSDSTNEDTDKLRSILKGPLLSNENILYIKLHADFISSEDIAYPLLYWGGNLDTLIEMSQSHNLYEIDKIFNVIYIDSYINLNTLFKKNISKLLVLTNNDDDILNEINSDIDNLNNKLSNMDSITKIENDLSSSLQKLANDLQKVSIVPEISLNRFQDSLTPYIHQENDNKLYPTSGDGRKKLICYSLINLLANNNDLSKINIYLIEEPENHLHKSLQIALSNMLFNDNNFNYLFLTTHSSYILYEMDNVNLVRIYNNKNINTSSLLFRVPSNYQQYKKMLTRTLSEAIFSNKVLLVEGISELLLFEKVLSVVYPNYEAKGIYILCVNGISFEKYVEILTALNIKTIIKTDNDLKECEQKHNPNSYFLGFKRCNNLINDKNKSLPIDEIDISKLKKSEIIKLKKEKYAEHKDLLDLIRKEHNIYLSICDLENDLYDVLKEPLTSYLKQIKDNPKCKKNVVNYLQESKCYNMAKMITYLTDDDCRTIYEHYNFACLKEVTKTDDTN